MAILLASAFSSDPSALNFLGEIGGFLFFNLWVGDLHFSTQNRSVNLAVSWKNG
jgi:hypothetical protein